MTVELPRSESALLLEFKHEAAEFTHIEVTHRDPFFTVLKQQHIDSVINQLCCL